MKLSDLKPCQECRDREFNIEIRDAMAHGWPARSIIIACARCQRRGEGYAVHTAFFVDGEHDIDDILWGNAVKLWNEGVLTNEIDRCGEIG